MTKAEFLRKLRESLLQLPESEIEKHIQYYDEMISDRVEDGMTEESAVAGLEDVDVISQGILQDVSLPVLVKTKVRPRGGWTVTAIVLAVVLSPLWLVLACVGFAVFVTVFAVLFSLAAAAAAVMAALIISGAALVLSAFFSFSAGAAFVLAVLAAGFLLLGLGALAVIAVKYVFTGIGKLSGLVMHSIKSLFIRKESTNDQIY